MTGDLIIKLVYIDFNTKRHIVVTHDMVHGLSFEWSKMKGSTVIGFFQV